jgi:hypothetical protein
MKGRHGGNPEAPAGSRQDSSLSTKKKISEAIQRIRECRTRIVTPGTKLSVDSVSKEAEVARSSIYRYHKDTIAEIRGEKKSGAIPTTAKDRKASAELEEKLRKANQGIRDLEDQLMKVLREKHFLQRELREEREKAAGNVVALRGESVVVGMTEGVRK